MEIGKDYLVEIGFGITLVSSIVMDASNGEKNHLRFSLSYPMPNEALYQNVESTPID